MDEKNKKIKVPNINELSEIFLETLKEISKSGTNINAETFSRFLAKSQLIKDLLRLAKKAQKKSPKIKIDTEMQVLQSQLDAAEENKKQILKDIYDLEGELDREKDFNKRVSLIFMNLSHVHGNVSFYELLDNYKQLVIDEADYNYRENILNEIKNQMLKEDINAKKGHYVEDEGEIDASQAKPPVLRRFFGDSTEIKLKPLKKAGLKALEELRSIFGNNFADSIAKIEHRITECENIDYLLSQRKQIIKIIQDYVRQIQNDRNQITGFIKEVGKRLIEMEESILITFTYSSQSIDEDYKFNENLKERIKSIGISVEKSKNFEDLRSLIISELVTITKTIDEKRREYSFRIEKANKEKEKLQQHFQEMINDVIEQNKALIEQNQKDPLTGILNRVTFDDYITIELQRYKRYKETFSLILFDIDYFKNVNDTYGHEAGDRVLKGIAICIEDILRKTDLFARYGGEEFVVLMSNTNLGDSLSVAKKLREIVQETEFIYEGITVPITVSVGITEVNPSDNDIKTILKRVDRLMYKAKEGGRNTVISDSDLEL